MELDSIIKLMLEKKNNLGAVKQFVENMLSIREGEE
jgi:hypothetical protein